MAEDVQGLLRNEIANNWIVETSLSIAEAREKWPLGIAVGKLNVVFAEGKEPRLVLDSAVRQVNTRCHLPERLSLPMASDLALPTQPEETPGAFIGASVTNRCKSARLGPSTAGQAWAHGTRMKAVASHKRLGRGRWQRPLWL